MGNSSGKIVSYSGLVFLTLSQNYQLPGGIQVDFVTIDQHGCVTLFVYNLSTNQKEAGRKSGILMNAFSRLSFQDIREMCESHYHLRFEFVFEEKFDRVPSLVRPFSLDTIRVITFVSPETRLQAVNLDLYISGPTNALIFEYVKTNYQLSSWIIEEVSSPVKARVETDEAEAKAEAEEAVSYTEYTPAPKAIEPVVAQNPLPEPEPEIAEAVEPVVAENEEFSAVVKPAEAPVSTAKSFALEDDFIVGIPAMDQQHKVFFDIYKQIAELSSDDSNFDQLVYTINKLKYYIRTHFRAEEELMRKAGFDGLEDHIREHQMFVEKIDSFSFGLEYKNPQLANQLLLFIRKWLLTHVSKTDMLYVECVKAYLNERSA